MDDKKNNLTLKQKVGYGLGDAGGCLTFALMGSTFAMYCTDALGIDEFLLAALLFIWNVWDFINDPLMGALMDKMFAKNKNPKGKFRPWLLRATPLIAVTFIALWSVPQFFDGNYDKLEIKGYNYISKIETSSYSRNQEQSLEKAFSNIEFKTKSNKIKTNIYPKIKEFIEKKEVLSENEMNNYFDNNNEIIINQNQKLIIYYLSINYDENDLVDNYNINAYLLEK